METKWKTKKLIGAAIGNCVHVAGLIHFNGIAIQAGWEVKYLGPAVSVSELIKETAKLKPDLLAVSYRLTPEVAKSLFIELKQQLDDNNLSTVKLALGCTPPVAEVARQLEMFDVIFTGGEKQDATYQYLSGNEETSYQKDLGDTLLQRIKNKSPYPLLRHHFGQPTVAETVTGAQAIAQAQALDVLSLGPDQNAQEYFFKPEYMKPELNGAGGVPLRHADDLREIYNATRCGNHPLLRIYAGTNDLLRWAELSVETIHNAWGAIPLFWYSVLDGRSQRSLFEAISEHQEVMRWYAQHNIPVECNEAHQWSMREAPDVIAVAVAYLGALNAKAQGVNTYVAQYMLNSPASTSGCMDLGKMLAKIDLIETLHDDNFQSIRQIRAGLLSFSPDPAVAKGQLAASTVLAMALKPEIYHVVGFSEGDHAATAQDIIESCSIADGVIHNTIEGWPDLTMDPLIQERREHLKAEALILLDAISSLGSGNENALTQPSVLSQAVEIGLLNAPHLVGRPGTAKGIITQTINGGIQTINPQNGEILSEKQRIELIFSSTNT